MKKLLFICIGIFLASNSYAILQSKGGGAIGQSGQCTNSLDESSETIGYVIINQGGNPVSKTNPLPTNLTDTHAQIDSPVLMKQVSGETWIMKEWYQDKTYGGTNVLTYSSANSVAVSILPATARIDSVLVACNGTSAESVDIYWSSIGNTFTLLGGENYSKSFYFIPLGGTWNLTIRGNVITTVRFQAYWIIP